MTRSLRSRSFVLACAVSLAATSPVMANAKQDRASLAQLEAAYQATGKLAAGPERTQQACADADKLHAAAGALPQKRAPSGAPVDDLTWSAAVNVLEAVVGKLGTVCKASDHRIQIDLQGKKFETAEQVVDNLDHRVAEVLDRARPRDVPAALKKFQATLAGMRATGKALCSQHGKLARLAPDAAGPPLRADAARWQQASERLKASLDEVKQFGCGTPRGADEEIAGALSELHDRYYELVLLIPPKT